MLCKRGGFFTPPAILAPLTNIVDNVYKSITFEDHYLLIEIQNFEDFMRLLSYLKIIDLPTNYRVVKLTNSIDNFFNEYSIDETKKNYYKIIPLKSSNPEKDNTIIIVDETYFENELVLAKITELKNIV